MSWSFEPVGNNNTGPTPQIQPPAVGALDEMNTLCTTSPIRNWLPAPGATLSCEITGSLVWPHGKNPAGMQVG